MIFVCGGCRARRFMSIVWPVGDSYEALGLVSDEKGVWYLLSLFTVVLHGGSRAEKSLRLYQAFAFSLVLSFHFSPPCLSSVFAGSLRKNWWCYWLWLIYVSRFKYNFLNVRISYFQRFLYAMCVFVSVQSYSSKYVCTIFDMLFLYSLFFRIFQLLPVFIFPY